MSPVANDLGFTLPLTPLAAGEQLEYAVTAERLGYRTCWLSEACNAESFALAGAIAARTGLHVATGIVPVFNRTPMVLAMGAATLSHLTAGRFILGLGSSTERIIGGWNGVTYAKPLTRMRETIHVVRQLLAGETVTFEGETLQVRRARLEDPPAVAPPIHVAALNQRMLRLAGEVADGVIINLLGPEHVPTLVAAVAEGAVSAGRSPADVEIVIRLQVALDLSREQGRARSREVFGPYVAASGYSRFFRSIGFETEVDAIASALQAGDRRAVEDAFTDELADALLVSGTPDECRVRFDEYRTAGVDSIVLIPQANSAQECWDVLRRLGSPEPA